MLMNVFIYQLLAPISWVFFCHINNKQYFVITFRQRVNETASLSLESNIIGKQI